MMMTFDEWLENEQAKCDKIRDEITELKKQLNNHILEIAKAEYPDKEINRLRDVNWILIKQGGRFTSLYDTYGEYRSVLPFNEKIDVKRNELNSRSCDLSNARKFDNGVEFLSRVDEIERLESEVKQAESELSKLKERLKSVRGKADYQKARYIENKNSYDKLLKEFEESHKEVAA